jgi:hypothetical protein
MSWLTTIANSLVQYWGRISLMLGVAILAVLGFTIVPVVWGNSPTDKGVVAEWNETIGRLGIEPVFPPEEDIHVGDLYAVIRADRRPKNKDKPATLLNYGIKLDHINLDRVLISTYNELPQFPATTDRPKEGEPWAQSPNENGVFAPSDKRKVLALAAFPGFTIRSNREATAGLSAWAGLFGASQQDNDTVEVRIPFAETYGIPSLLASGVLQRYCDDPYTGPVCKDANLRNHLNNVRAGMYDVEDDPDTGQKRYAVDVELVLINRVYLVRSIEQTRSLGRTQSTALRAFVDTVSDEAKTAAAAAAAGDAKAIEQLKALQSVLDKLKINVPGGVLSLTSGSDSLFELKQTFPRPIVIGYRAVRVTAARPNLNIQNVAPGQGGTSEDAAR